MADREKGKKRRRPWRRIAIILILLLLLIAMGLSIWIVFFTDVFNIREVKVSGMKRLGSDYVRQLSGVDGYENLITLPVKNLRKNLLQEPWIKEVRISRRLPGTVIFKVEERNPVAGLDMGEDAYLIDGEGYVIDREAKADATDVQLIRYRHVVPPEVGSNVQDKEILSAIKILGNLSPGLKGAIKCVDPFDKKGSVLESRDGIKIYYGKAENFASKNKALEAIFKDIQERKLEVEYIDVRIPENPVVGKEQAE